MKQQSTNGSHKPLVTDDTVRVETSKRHNIMTYSCLVMTAWAVVPRRSCASAYTWLLTC